LPKPIGYPLSWCEELDCPYWSINFSLCIRKKGWREWQKKLSMAEIIPHIDKLLEGNSLEIV